MPTTPKYRAIADDLRQQIETGQLTPGQKLPHTEDLMATYGASKQTIRTAVDVLAQEGLVLAKRRAGTVVRDKRKLQISLSRYRASLESNGRLGPFEAACEEQGLRGEMKTVGVDQVHDPDIAARLGLPEGDALICRRRDALIEDQVVQFQYAYYPLAVAQAAGLDKPGKVVGGVNRALESAGIPVFDYDEHVASRPPTREEADALGTGIKGSVITIEKISRDETGRPIELLHVIAAADRITLTYTGIRPPRSSA